PPKGRDKNRKIMGKHGINNMFNLFGKKITEERVEELGTREFEELINILEDGVITYAADFTIISINRSAERILGIKKENVVGQKITPDMKGNKNVVGLVEVIFPSLAPVVVQISESGWPQITDMELEEPPIRIRATLAPLTGKNGENLGFIKIIRDKIMENEMFNSKQEFLDVAAHQLRTPLTAIGWAFETLGKELEGNAELKPITDEGKNLAERSLKIVNDLLDAARIGGGKFGYAFTEINLSELVRNIASEGKRIAETWGMTLAYSSPPEPILIQGDANRISMALGNLIDNAIKYNTEHGSINVCLEKDPKEPFVKITVQDTGVGIPEKELRMLFRKFSRGSKAKQLEPNGSGLGLYVARNIAKNHGGDIVVQSTPDRGSTFTITFPTDPRLIPRRETAYENE
ncbi:MAG: PAS domain-containing sensor histidine kinase, partial [Nanoarchaeota archaeon]|nr:PAS domain-containing sensor histidine kinase [Nanoarchaeota archaeon]